MGLLFFFILHSCVPRIYTESVKSSSSTDSSSDPGTNAAKYIKAYTGKKHALDKYDQFILNTG